MSESQIKAFHPDAQHFAEIRLLAHLKPRPSWRLFYRLEHPQLFTRRATLNPRLTSWPITGHHWLRLWFRTDQEGFVLPLEVAACYTDWQQMQQPVPQPLRHTLAPQPSQDPTQLSYWFAQGIWRGINHDGIGRIQIRPVTYTRERKSTLQPFEVHFLPVYPERLSKLPTEKPVFMWGTLLRGRLLGVEVEGLCPTDQV